MTEEDKAVIKSIINEVLDKHGEKYCLPHEERITENEKLFVRVFGNGLKQKLVDLVKSLEDHRNAMSTFRRDVESKVDAVSKRFWMIPVSIVVSIVGAYFLRYLFP